MSVISERRIDIGSTQSNAGLHNTALEHQKKLQEASRIRTRNIAIGVITAAALATAAAYVGRDYIFGNQGPVVNKAQECAAQLNNCRTKGADSVCQQAYSECLKSAFGPFRDGYQFSS